MTVTLLKKLYQADTNDIENLYILAEQAKEDDHIGMSQYASLRASIKMLHDPEPKKATGKKRHMYSSSEIKISSKMLIKVANHKYTESEALTSLAQILPSDCGVIRNFSDYVKTMKIQLQGKRGAHLATPASWAKEILSQLNGIQQDNFLRAMRLQVEYDKQYGTKSKTLIGVLDEYAVA